MFFKNKHVITALIVAPILSIISYFAVDYVVKERPSAAVQGQSYPLSVRPNCRYTSGTCDLANAEFKTTVSVDKQQAQPRLRVEANVPLDGVKIGITNSQQQALDAPVSLLSDDAERRVWFGALTEEADQDSTLYIVMSSNGVSYYASTGMVFANYDTLFERDFRENK